MQSGNYTKQIKILSDCLQRAIPFVAYRLPGSGKICLLVAEKVDSFFFQGQDLFSHRGFVLVPFDNENAPAYFLKTRFDAELDSISIEQIQWIEQQPKIPLNLGVYHDFSCLQNYQQSFNKLFQAIQQGKIEKAILSRCHFVEHVEALKAASFFLDLCVLQSSTYNYLSYVPGCGLWMGASPELFLCRNECFFETVSLAGTMKQSNQMDWSKKDLKEQNIVTNYISEQLRDFNVDVVDKIGPKTVSVGQVAHLKTVFHFSKDSLPKNVGKFVEAFHPTPAVCGYPKKMAKQLILQTETHQRSLYGGFLGKIDADGQFSFYVNIRCVQFFENGVGLYVGGGITAMSNVEEEYNETLLKADGLMLVLSK